MFDDKVAQAISDRGLGSFRIVEEPRQPEPAGPEAQKLQRQGRIYRNWANSLDNLAALEHGYARSQQLYQEAKACHDIADKYFEEAKVLSHYGRPGMKWGIRRTKKQLGAERDAAKSEKKALKKANKFAKKQLKAGDKAGTKAGKIKKQARKMSDEDLKTAVDRLQMEKKYSELTSTQNKKTKTRIQRGKAEMANIAKRSASSAVQAHTTNIMKQALTAGIKKTNKNYVPPKNK